MIVADIPKGKALIRVSLDDYKGRRVVDVRVWYLPKDGAEYVPSRKGVTCDSSMAMELAAAMIRAANQ